MDNWPYAEDDGRYQQQMRLEEEQRDLEEAFSKILQVVVAVGKDEELENEIELLRWAAGIPKRRAYALER